MKLFIIKSSQDAKYFLSKHFVAMTDKNACVLALMPSAQAFLKKQGVVYQTTLGLIDKEEHKTILKKISTIDPVIQGHAKKYFQSMPYRAFEHILSFWIRFHIIDYLFFGTVLAKIFKVNQIASVYIANNFNSNEQWEISLSGVVRDACQSREIALHEWKRTQNKWMLLRCKMIFSSLVNWALYYCSYGKMKIIGRKRPIMCLSSNQYNLDIAAKYLQQRIDASDFIYCYLSFSGSLKLFFRQFIKRNTVAFKALPDIGINVGGLLKQVEHCYSDFWSSFRDIPCFSNEAIMLQNVFPKSFKMNQLKTLQKLAIKEYYLKKIASHHRIKVVLSQMCIDETFILGELARKHGIPSYLISHGSHVPTQNKYAAIEWEQHSHQLLSDVYSHLMIQSPWAMKHLSMFPKRSNKVLCGPLLFSVLNQRGLCSEQNQSKVVILHAGTPKPFGSLRLWVYETIDEYIAGLRHLIEVCSDIPNVTLVIRFRPQAHFSVDDLKTCLPTSSHYQIETGGSLAESLSKCHLLVSYSSTVIEEALMSKIPVLLYSHDDRYCHIPEVETEHNMRDLYYAGSKCELKSHIHQFANNIRNKQVIPDYLFERHMIHHKDNILETA